MAADTFDTTTATSLLSTYLHKRFIPTLEKELQLGKFCTRAEIPDGSGKTARWNIFSNTDLTTTELVEGTTTGNETEITTTGAEATIAEYGEFIFATELSLKTMVKGTREALSERMAYGGAEVLDTVIREGQTGGDGAVDATTAFHTTAAATGGDTTGPSIGYGGSAAAIIGASKLLRDNNCPGFSSVAGHPPGEYAAIVSPKYELSMVTEDQSANNRMTWAQAVTNVPGAMGQEKWVKGYMGSVYGTACYRTTNHNVSANDDICYILAKDALGCMDLGDTAAQVYVNNPSSGDIGNPYRNKSTISWHAYFACDLIDNNRIVKVLAINDL